MLVAITESIPLITDEMTNAEKVAAYESLDWKDCGAKLTKRPTMKPRSAKVRVRTNLTFRLLKDFTNAAGDVFKAGEILHKQNAGQLTRLNARVGDPAISLFECV